MARPRLTKKQRIFVNEYADTGNGTQAALKAYDTDKTIVAANIAVENLSKPYIQEELKKLGFDENTAKEVVGTILINDEIEPQHRLKAAEQVFKVSGSYAPDKQLTLTLDAQLTKDEGELAGVLIELLS